MERTIYVITNKNNGKLYVGQTSKTIEERFKKHLQDSLCEVKKHRMLYEAIREYGEDSFMIKEIEKCDESIADSREQFWIKQFQSFGQNGYNATIGGRAYKPYYYETIAECLREGKGTREIVAEIGCCRDLVYKVSHMYGLTIPSAKHNIPVVQSDKDGRIVASYGSVAEAARAIKALGQHTPENTIRKNISRCCNRTSRTTAYGYKWSHAV